MRFFENCKTIEELKKEYKKLAFKHHPDRGGDVEIMKMINNEYQETLETLKTQSSSKQDQTSTEGAEEFINIINTLIVLEGLKIEVVGNWLWITGETKTHKEILKGVGCYYASKKKAWYHKPSDYVGRSRKNYSLDEIRARHGSYTVTGEVKSKQKSNKKPMQLSLFD